jgi:uracil-DNA glycosylase family 4
MRRPFFPPSELMVIKAPMSKEPECGSCKLLNTCNSPKMPVSGGGRRKVLLVAEAPGKDEDRVGKQFVGNSGQLLEDRLARGGLDMRRDCWLTNALICRPPDNKIPKPEERYIGYCRPNLINTINELKPEVIILMGSVPVTSLLAWLWKDDKLGGITRWAGYQIPDQKLNAWVCPIFHPAALQHSKNEVMDRLFDRHLIAAAKLRGRPWKEKPDYTEKLIVYTDPEEAADMIDSFCPSGSQIAFDYETNMLKPDSNLAQIYSCSICPGGTVSFAFPWHGRAIKAVRNVLRNKKIEKLGQNIKFEERWTWKAFGHGVKNWRYDAMIGSHCLDNGGKTRAVTSIKFQAYVLRGVAPWDEHVKPFLSTPGKKGGNAVNRIKQVALESLLKYNAMDSLMEYEVGQIQLARGGYRVRTAGCGRRRLPCPSLS